jgi:hypothetical protein
MDRNRSSPALKSIMMPQPGVLSYSKWQNKENACMNISKIATNHRNEHFFGSQPTAAAVIQLKGVTLRNRQLRENMHV